MIEINGKLFDWDKYKNLSNISKHGVSFKAAALSFFDPNVVSFYDEDHSQDEDRFIVIGYIKKEKLLTVSHCYRDKGNVVRIISARKANKAEQDVYGGDI